MSSVPSDTDCQGRLNYVHSCDLEAKIAVKIGTLEGKRRRPTPLEVIQDPMLQFSGFYEECSDLFVTVQVFNLGKPFMPRCQTRYKAFTNRWNWNEWITLPTRYNHLYKDAQLVFTVFDRYGVSQKKPVGGTTISLFSKRGNFRCGMYDLELHLDREGCGKVPTETPGKRKDPSDKMVKLTKLTKKHRTGLMPRAEWLDRLTFREIELINEKQKRDSDKLYLNIQFQQLFIEDVPHSIVYFEKGADVPNEISRSTWFQRIPDPELEMENLIEKQHHKLARRQHSGIADRELKPNTEIKNQLERIVNYPSTQPLNSEEQDLVWKYRFYLSSIKKALSKFVKSINWSLESEAKDALDLLAQWAPMDTVDALELLSPAFTHPAVRRYAVSRLNDADDAELLMYILQLVQALKYEQYHEIIEAFDETSTAPVPGVGSPYDPTVHALPEEQASDSTSHTAALREALLEDSINQRKEHLKNLDLATFLIMRACNNDVLASYFMWYLRVEIDVQKQQETANEGTAFMYETVFKRFSQALKNGDYQCRLRRNLVISQGTKCQALDELIARVYKNTGGSRVDKETALIAALSDPKENMMDFEPMPLPLDPRKQMTGIIPSETKVYKSAQLPCRLTFKIKGEAAPYIAIYKRGDDLRQDQLVLQIISLMDQLLLKEKLDLHLTPYKVLATSSGNGMVQFIESTTINELTQKGMSIQEYFRQHSPSVTGPFGIEKEVMEAYVKSCAGYCIITYILGVGDRHLDNLMIRKTGELFHIDFGYLLGRDPKPMPPPMKLSKEMIEALGGINSEMFSEFKQHCYSAFAALRRSSTLILNLFALMVDSNVPEIAIEPDKCVKKVQDKLHLALSDEEMSNELQKIIEVSCSSTMGNVMDKLHSIAQYWRK